MSSEDHPGKMVSSSETRLSVDAKEHDDLLENVGDDDGVRLVSEEDDLAKDDSDNLKVDEGANPLSNNANNAAQMLPLLNDLLVNNEIQRIAKEADLSSQIISLLPERAHKSCCDLLKGEYKEGLPEPIIAYLVLKTLSHMMTEVDDDMVVLGLCALHLANGQAPFVNFTPKELLLDSIRNKLYLKKDFSKNFRNFLAMCLLREEVPTPDTLLNSDFVQSSASQEEFEDAMMKIDVTEETEQATYTYVSGCSKEKFSEERFLDALSTWRSCVGKFSKLKVPEKTLDMWQFGDSSGGNVDKNSGMIATSGVPLKENL